MAKFMYQAKLQSGQMTTGQLEAIDEGEARSKLRSKNLTPLRLVKTAGDTTPGIVKGLDSLFAKKVPSRDLQIFTRQFSTLINAGIPIISCFQMLSEGKRNPILKDAALRIKDSIETGKRLGDAMAQHSHIFDRFYVNMVRAGEEAGILDGILGRMAVYLEKAEKLKKQVQGAMFYPGAVIAISALVITGILVFIIPKFQDLYKQGGRPLPALTQFVVDLSQFFIHKWYFVIMIAIGVPFAFMTWARTPEGKKTLDRMLIKAPLFGELVQKSSVARMTRTLSTLLSSGIAVLDALDIAARTAGNSVIEEALNRSKESVIQGRSMTAPLAKEPMIPDMVSQMIGIGETSGTLDVMLGKIADFYEEDVENAVKGLTSMIEPIMMVFLGGIIAVLVIAMYLPVFDMASTVH